MDVASYFLQQTRNNPDSTIAVDAAEPCRSYSWKQYLDGIKSVAVGLKDLGVAEQACVGLISDNDIYYFLLGNGVLAAGAVFAPVTHLGKVTEVVNCFQAGNVEWVFASTEQLDKALAAAREAGIDDSRVLVFDPPGKTPFSGARPTFSQILRADGSKWQRPACLENPDTAVSVRMFTSGTTGTPKAADTTHGAVMRRIERLKVPALVENFFQNVAQFHPSPMAVWYRLLHFEGSVFNVSAASDPTVLLDQIQSLGVDSTWLAPRTADELAREIAEGQRSRETLGSLKSVCLTGSISGPETLKNLKAVLPANARLMNFYGSTEVGLISGGAEYPQCLAPFVGKPVSEVKIIDPETLEELPLGSQGEVCARSDSMIIGYYRNPEATAKAFLPDPHGAPWFRMGDRGFIDPSTGMLGLTGRFKEIFKIGVEEVSPAEVEAELFKHPGVRDCAITTIQDRNDARYVETIAYVVRTKGSNVTAQEILDFVASRMARYKAPTGGVVFCEFIPRNSLKKTVRRELQDQREYPGSAKYLTISE